MIPAGEYDRPRALAAAIYLNVVSVSVFIVQPGFVQVVVERLHFTDAQAGFVTATEMWGLAVATVLMTALTGRLDWRRMAAVAVLAMVAGNLLSLVPTSPGMFGITRLLVGLGGGVLASLGFSSIGLTSAPDRNFAYLNMCVLLYGAVVLWALPPFVHEVGVPGMLLFFAMVAAAMLPFIRLLPRSERDGRPQGVSAVNQGHSRGAALLVATNLLFFVGVGSVWAYLALIGTAGGASDQSVATALMVAQLSGAAGSLVAARLENRVGRRVPIGVGLCVCAVAIIPLARGPGMAVYALSVVAFNFAYNLVQPFLYAFLTAIDASRRSIRFAVASMMLGLASGPALAAAVVGDSRYERVVALGVVAFVGAIVTFTVLAFPRRGRGGSGACVSWIG